MPTARWMLCLVLVVAACGSEETTSGIADHPSFPCYTWWVASSRVAGLAGVVPWAGGGIITHQELFDFADEWVPDSQAAETLRQVHSEMPDESATDSVQEEWKVRVVVAVYEWALFNLDLAREAVDSSTEVRVEDREPLLEYVTALEGSVEDQWALAVPLFDRNPAIDVTTLGVLTGTPASDRLFQAWRDVTEESPFDTEAGIKDAAINVCGEDVLGIG